MGARRRPRLRLYYRAGGVGAYCRHRGMVVPNYRDHYPSYLTSWIHSAPAGTLVPRVGMQGSNGVFGMLIR